MHGAFRTGGTFLYVPRDTKVELPLQTLTYLDVDGAAVFPHTLIVVEAGAEVTFIDRYASPDLTRAFCDAITEIHVGDGAHVRYASIQDWGAGMTHLAVQRARVGRDADLRTLEPGLRRRSRTHGDRGRARRARRLQRDAGVFFADGEQHFDHRSMQDHVAPNCTSDLLYKGALRDRSRAVYSRLGPRAPRRTEDRRDADEPQHRPVRARESRRDPQPRDRGERREVWARGERRAGRGRHALLPASPAGSPARRPSG